MDDSKGDLSPFEKAKADCRAEYRAADLKMLVKMMDVYQQRKEELEEKLSVVNACFDVLRYELVPERMELDGVENVRYDGIGRVALTPDLFVSTKPDMKDKLFGWFRKHKLADLIQPSINSSTLKAFIKNRIKTGKDYPSEYLNVTPVTRASITRS